MSELYAWLGGLALEGRLPAAFQYPFFVRGLLSVLLLAPILGGMSHLVVARRLSFFSAALGQAALTGLTIGLLLGEPGTSAYGGIFGFCMLAALGMVYVKRHASLPPDTLVGVFLAMTLGLGICLLVAVAKRFNVHQIEAIMFGSLLTVTDTDLGLLLGVGVVVTLVLAWVYNRLLLDSVDPALASVAGARTILLDYLFVVLLTATIVVSLKVIGALLVEAMVVVPAAAARNLARSARSYLALSIAISLASGVAGLFLSAEVQVPSGGAVVLFLSVAFFLTLGVAGVLALLRGDRGATEDDERA